MSTKDKVENMARNTWLAGLGAIESSVEALAKSIETAQKQTNNLYNEFLTRGQEIQSKINDTKDDVEARGKKFFGIDSTESHEEKLSKLNVKVDHLTTVVAKLMEKHNAETPSARTVPKKAVKAPSKATAKSKLASEKKAQSTKSATKATKATVNKTMINTPSKADTNAKFASQKVP